MSKGHLTEGQAYQQKVYQESLEIHDEKQN